ncbi:MAG: hypothetical protein GDA44_08685 [Prochloron sp. SP5CPC1]|nr:hypothetical protein [Candidatus Paraprochloron terpiosi SP5CPC1]
MPIEPEEKQDSTIPPEEIRQGISSEKVAFYDDALDLSPSQYLSPYFPYKEDNKFKIEEKQEETRSQLATFLIKILAGTLTASFGLILLLTLMLGFVDDKKAKALENNSSLVKDLITFILTAQTGLIGTALGFYFGSRDSSNSD